MSGIFVHVGTPDFRSALRSVLPHADKTKTGGDGTSALHRVRLSIGLAECIVMATNGSSSAMALVPLVREDGSSVDVIDRVDDAGNAPRAEILDLVPRQVRRILQTFEATKGEKDGMTQVLAIASDGDGVDIDDVAGLVAGDGIRCALQANGSGFPDVYGIIAAAHDAAQQTPHPKPLTSHGAQFLAFTAAAAAYDQELTIVPTGTAESRGFLVECGFRFLGTLESRHQDDDSLRRRERARTAWRNRFANRQLAVV